MAALIGLLLGSGQQGGCVCLLTPHQAPALVAYPLWPHQGSLPFFPAPSQRGEGGGEQARRRVSAENTHSADAHPGADACRCCRQALLAHQLLLPLPPSLLPACLPAPLTAACLPPHSPAL